MNEPAEAERIGEVMGGKYRVVRLLARGGMSVVYEAQHTLVRRRFAIKLLRRDLAERRDILERFQREAATAGGLENENVAAAVDFGITDDATPYIVMEFLVGESLGALLERRGRLPVSRAADLIVQACRGVAAAHAAEIVHRDLKPHNLFLCRRDDGTDLVKVLDFGVAKLQALEEQSAATRTGTMLGTTAYMSPEQARGERTVDGRTDIYALGAIFYELVSQRRPHPGESQNAILHHIASYPAVPLESVEPDLPAGLAEVVGRALASDPTARQASAEMLAAQLAPFARREVWADAPESARREPPARAVDLSRSTGPEPAPERRAPGWRAGVLLVGLAAALLAVGAGVRRHRAATPAPGQAPRAHRDRGFDPKTRFLGMEPPPGAVAHIEALLKSNRVHDAALVSAMVGTPSAIWFLGGTPEQVRLDVSDAVTRGGRQGRLPVLVAYNHPFRDCTGYGLIGSTDSASYQAWIDGFASAIGNERVIVILEPSSLGLIPYGPRLDGREDKCRPTRAGVDGQRVSPPGATAEQRYAELRYAVDSLAARAPRAAVYLDGTHSAWLPVGDIAYRLARAGVDRTAGFFLNSGNYQPTQRQIQYGTWISKCLYRAAHSGADPLSAKPYKECATQSDWMDPNDDQAWAKVDRWYTEQVDRGPNPPAGPDDLTHFVINTNRNGRGPLDLAVYAQPPYNQPPAVIQALRDGSWCMPPGRGLGLRPTVTTGVPLVDAYLWTDMPGLSVAACDIAGGARAWDYTRYNPWDLSDEAQSHFDPLWGRVLLPSGEWFPDGALELARNATPPLGLDEPVPPERAALVIPAPGPSRPAPSAGRPPGHKAPRGRPEGNRTAAAERAPATPAPPSSPSFDTDNPYK
ncbi:MAG TPA: glycoside hydrolase family 6 protein [Polyangia bacterium]|nr:glycoside hydrolase family 6 protein [Polyangia bacterium]